MEQDEIQTCRATKDVYAPNKGVTRHKRREPGSGVRVMQASTDSRRKRDIIEAKARAARAKQYAEKFPQFAKPDSEYCTVEWQLKQLQGFKEKSCPQK